MKRILYTLRCFSYYFWGRVFAFFFYDSKYLKSRWLTGQRTGMYSEGWKWVYHDALYRIFWHENQTARFPIAPGVKVLFPENIEFNPDDLNNFQTYGNYFQAIGKITIGRGTYIAPNTGFITANHDLNDLKNHTSPKPIELGNDCWIGMNSVVLPGVKLGPHTIVGAGSVVTKSFEEGYCVIAGVPAKIIRYLDNKQFLQ